MTSIEDKFYIEAEKTASRIAEKANECCYRTDGYEEDIKKFALDSIKKIIDIVVDACY